MESEKIGLDRYTRLQREQAQWLVARVELVGYGVINVLLGCFVTVLFYEL